MLNAAWYWWGGYVWVAASGKQVERFLNLLVARGIAVWGVTQADSQLQLYMTVDAFRGIRPLARQTKTRVHIRAKLGLPFFLVQFRKRRMLIAGALLFALCLYLLSSFIWFVEVEGLETIDRSQLLAEASHYGIAPGELKGRARVDEFVFQLPMKYKRIAWVAVRYVGTKATIKVIEQTLPPTDALRERGPADVVAAKAGLVEEVLVLAGTPLVSEGDVVQPGQTLISAVLTPGVTAAEGVPDTELEVHARGRVKARVWYDAYSEAPLVFKDPIRTGATFVRRMIRLGPEEITLTGRTPVPFKRYEVAVQRQGILPWRKVELPVEVITLYYHEVVYIEKRVDRSAAIAEATQVAKQRLTPLIPIDVPVRDVKEQVVLDQPDVVGVRVIIETVEDIGVTVPRNPAPPGPTGN